MLYVPLLLLIRTKMEAFKDFINLLRLRVNIYHNAKVCGNWLINEHALGATCFHVVTTGQCLLDIPGHFQTEFNRGDLVIFPRELEHTMRSIGDTQGEQQHLSYSSSIDGTGMLCGEVSLMHLYRSKLLDALPPVLLIRNTAKTEWLDRLVKLMLDESNENESTNDITINRLSELMFIYALRHYLTHEKTESGILALYANNKIATALEAFHKKPELKWDLASLASTAGMSRTVFSDTFKRLSHWTVNQYTTWWRMQHAWELLKAGEKVSEVALSVGYQSEAAFSRAFRKQFEISAGDVRRGLDPGKAANLDE